MAENAAATELPPAPGAETAESNGVGGEVATISGGATRLPNLTREYHTKIGQEWYDRGRHLCENSASQFQESNRIRKNISIINSQVNANDKWILNKLNNTFRNKINRTADLVRKLDTAVKGNLMESTNLTEAKRQMLKTREEIAVPLSRTLKRLELRSALPDSERVEDQLHYALEVERTDLTNMTNQLNQMMEAVDDMLERLATMRARMTEDMNHKKHASALDNICLALNHKQAPLYPPKAETLHIKGAVEAGRTPAAAPTAMLLGEEAVQRFNYEWLFSTEDVEKMRESFDKLRAVDGTIAAADLEVLLGDTGLLIDDPNIQPVLELTRLQPDNRLTWDLMMLSLAKTKGGGETMTVRLASHWLNSTMHNLETNHALLMAAGRLRYQACELANYGADTKRRDHMNTGKQLRLKIQETQKLRGWCEKSIIASATELKKLEALEQKLVGEYEGKARPLAVAEARYNIRRRRKGGEEVHDEVEDGLIEELKELQAGVDCISRELERTRQTLAGMRGNNDALQQDFADKTFSIELHTKCLRMDPENRPNRKPARSAFLTGEV